MKTIFRALSATFGMFALCMMVLGCQSDEESYDGKTMSLQEAKMEILRLANEYDLNVSLNDSILESKLPTLDLKEIEAQMEAVASLKGTITNYVGKQSKSMQVSSNNKSGCVSMYSQTETETPAPSTQTTNAHQSYQTSKKTSDNKTYYYHFELDMKISWRYDKGNSNDGSETNNTFVKISETKLYGSGGDGTYFNDDTVTASTNSFSFTSADAFSFNGSLTIRAISTTFDLHILGSYSNGLCSITIS